MNPSVFAEASPPDAKDRESIEVQAKDCNQLECPNSSVCGSGTLGSLFRVSGQCSLGAGRTMTCSCSFKSTRTPVVCDTEGRKLRGSNSARSQGNMNVANLTSV